jgi:hypothetical protein
MECKQADPMHKRSRSISQHPENRHPLGVQNPFYGTKLCKYPNYHISYQPSRWESTCRFSHNHRKIHKTSRTCQIWTGPHSGNKYKHQRLGWKCDHLSHLLPPPPPSNAIKKEQYNAFINSLGHRFLVAGDFNAKYQYWGSRLISPKNRKLYQTIQEKQLEILSTGEPTYWPKDINKTADLLDFFIFKGLLHNSLETQSRDSIEPHTNNWQEDLSAGRWRVFLSRSCCQETASGDSNRLRTLVCVSVIWKV